LNGDLTARVAVATAAMPWSPSPSGTVWRKRVHLVGPPEAGQVTSIVRYEPNSTFHTHAHPDGEEIFVLDGSLAVGGARHAAGSWLRFPVGDSTRLRSETGCTLYVKRGGLPYLRSSHDLDE